MSVDNFNNNQGNWDGYEQGLIWNWLFEMIFESYNLYTAPKTLRYVNEKKYFYNNHK